MTHHRDTLRTLGERLVLDPWLGEDLLEAAIALGADELGKDDIGWYFGHAREMSEAIALGFEAEDRGTPAVERARRAMAGILGDRYGYRGDDQSYDDADNANLLRVMDRRKGLPVALGILWCDMARRQGWEMAGLNFPAHFLVRLTVNGQRQVIDPFFVGIHRPAEDLRSLIKAVGGAGAELSPQHYETVDDRAMLLRLVNNTRQRRLAAEDWAGALACLDRMLLLAPQEPELWFACAALNARLEQFAAATSAAEIALELPASPSVHQNAAALLQHLKTRLN